MEDAEGAGDAGTDERNNLAHDGMWVGLMNRVRRDERRLDFDESATTRQEQTLPSCFLDPPFS
jgi:hypothetical protein